MSIKVVFILIGLAYYAIKWYIENNKKGEKKQKANPTPPIPVDYHSPFENVTQPEKKRSHIQPSHLPSKSASKLNKSIFNTPIKKFVNNETQNIGIETMEDEIPLDYFEKRGKQIEEDFYSIDKLGSHSTVEIIPMNEEQQAKELDVFDAKSAFINQIIFERKF
jgi:hypothetical protein